MKLWQSKLLPFVCATLAIHSLEAYPEERAAKCCPPVQTPGEAKPAPWECTIPYGISDATGTTSVREINLPEVISKADLLFQERQFDKAETSYIEAINLLGQWQTEMRRRKENPSHITSEVGSVVLNDAASAKMQPLLERIVQIYEVKYSPYDWHVIGPLITLIGTCVEEDDFASAQRHQSRLFDLADFLSERGLSASHSIDLRALARQYTDKHLYGMAETVLNEDLKINERLLGRDHPFYIERLDELIKFSYARGDFEKGQQFMKRKLTCLPTKSPAPDAPRNAELLQSARRCMSQGLPGMGLEDYSILYQSFLSDPGPDYSPYLWLADYADALEKTGSPEQAVSMRHLVEGIKAKIESDPAARNK